MVSQKPIIKLLITMPKGVQTFELEKSEFVFGRSGKADVTIEDSGISREHLKIKFENDILYILDLNSLNGAFIDNNKIAAMEYVAVPEKSIISFGKCPVTIIFSVIQPDPNEVKTVIYQTEKKPLDSESFEIITYDPAENERKVDEKINQAITLEKSERVKNEKNKNSPPKVKQNISMEALPKSVSFNKIHSNIAQESHKTFSKNNEENNGEIQIEEHKKVSSQVNTVTDTFNEIKEENIVKNDPSKELNFSNQKNKIDSEKNIEILQRPEDKAEFNKLIDLSAFPKTEEDYRLSFKNVGLDLPKYKNPGEHAKEIIKEAEYQKHAIIKSAEVLRSKTINETRILSKRAADESHTEFKRLVDEILENTRIELKKLRTDTEILLDEKRIQANEEIQNLWAEHEEQIRADKEKQYQSFEKDNKIKLDLSIEKARSDMFAERHRIITDAENEVLQKKRAYQVEFENEKSEHLMKIRTYSEELLKTQTSMEECKKAIKDAKFLRDESELELSKILSQLKSEKENLAIINNSFKETEESHKVIERELAGFNETKQQAVLEIEKTQGELNKLNLTYSNLLERKQSLDNELESINVNLKDAKTKAKAEVENEYLNLKHIESQKFEDYKINELKELKKIRDAHTDSMKNFSVDLSQEIATKLELLASKSGYTKFDFDKHFELINSVIQIKAAINTGSESKHEVQLEGWKNRKRKENLSLMARGFAAGLACIFLLNFIYKKLNVDPVQLELARITAENKMRDSENKFIPVKSAKYYDSYVDTTIYTDRFAEVYLDPKNQQEWVIYATKYFLKQWKVEEEKVIEVISNSNALVQNVVESIPNLKKSKLKTDLAKMKDLEDQYIINQAKVLGSNVKYEAYKKLEKEFFLGKIEGRAPASQE